MGADREIVAITLLNYSCGGGAQRHMNVKPNKAGAPRYVGPKRMRAWLALGAASQQRLGRRKCGCHRNYSSR